MRTLTKEQQQALTPDDAIRLLKEGNERFINNLKLNRNLLQQVNETSDGQYPFAAILSCIDSRTSAELIFDQGLGDIFSIRIAGNILNEDILGSMEFACKLAGSKLVAVIGHTKCGAISGACKDVHLGHLTGLLKKISPAIEQVKSSVSQDDTEKFINLVTEENVKCVMKNLVDRSEILRTMLNEKKIGLIGGIYHAETGVVNFLD